VKVITSLAKLLALASSDLLGSVNCIGVMLLGFLEDLFSFSINLSLNLCFVWLSEASLAPEEDCCEEESEIHYDVCQQPPVLLWCLLGTMGVRVEDDLHIDKD
jgi:hypothetical protein